MRLRGIDIGPVKVDAALKTGVTVSISNASDRALVTFLGAITSLTGADIGDDLLAGVNHLHVSSYFLQQGLRADCRDLFRRASQRGITTSLDPGFDPAESWGSDLMDVLEFTDVFLPNEVELEAITKQREPAEALRSLENGRTAVVAKLGSRGAMSIDKGELVAVPAYHAGVLDTTGAGDSFNAGFLNAWLRGEPLLSAIRLGCACGALSTEGVGGTGGQPTLEQALRRMGSDDAAGQSASRA
jgi:sugar/nucleoside kinase (ribokinase family)